jgi:acetylornithine/succinyldiaminopimelate/putrescine aminotransferase
MDRWPVSSGEALHTSTFLGHPVGCAMALEAIRLHFEPETRAAVQRVTAALARQFDALALGMEGVREVRGRGAMWGVELNEAERAHDLVVAMLRAGYLLLSGGPKGKVLTFTPPFQMGENEIAAGLRCLRSIDD